LIISNVMSKLLLIFDIFIDPVQIVHPAAEVAHHPHPGDKQNKFQMFLNDNALSLLAHRHHPHPAVEEIVENAVNQEAKAEVQLGKQQFQIPRSVTRKSAQNLASVKKSVHQKEEVVPDAVEVAQLAIVQGVVTDQRKAHDPVHDLVDENAMRDQKHPSPHASKSVVSQRMSQRITSLRSSAIMGR
jgi:hypothetical protein